MKLSYLAAKYRKIPLRKVKNVEWFNLVSEFFKKCFLNGG